MKKEKLKPPLLRRNPPLQPVNCHREKPSPIQGRLSFEFQRLREMAHWVDMYKEIAVLRDEIEVQRRLAEYWEGRWRHKYSEKIELLHQNLELKRKYEGISDEALAMAQSTTAMRAPEETQRTGITRPPGTIFHAKKRGELPEQGERGRPLTKKGRGARGVQILETLKEDTPG